MNFVFFDKKHACMNAMQDPHKVITPAVLQAFMKEFAEQPIEFRSYMHCRKDSGAREWRRSANGIVGKCSKKNGLEFITLPEEGQIVKASFKNDRGAFLKLSDEKIWKFWLDEDLDRWVFMKDDFEVLQRDRYTEYK